MDYSEFKERLKQEYEEAGILLPSESDVILVFMSLLVYSKWNDLEMKKVMIKMKRDMKV